MEQPPSDDLPQPASDPANVGGKVPSSAGATPPAAPRRSTWRDRLRSRWKAIVLVLCVLVAASALLYQRLHPPQPTTVAKNVEQKKNPDDAPVEPFKFEGFTIRPSATDRIESGIKPGHWTAAALPITANFDNFHGGLTTEMLAKSGEEAYLDGVPYALRTARPVVLPKAQKKTLDIALFSPAEADARLASLHLETRTGRDVWGSREVVQPMPAEQYFFVVLSPQPAEYLFVQSLDSVWGPRGDYDDHGPQAPYRVLRPAILPAAPVPVPNHLNFWTSTAVVLWDSIDPNLLSTEQQQALVDWLHFGGQLIVSGPESLALLRGSFLDGYLPAAAGESWALTADDVAPLGRLYCDEKTPLSVSRSWTGEHLTTADREANVVVETPAGEPLIVERRVGRGRTVVTAFRLAQRELVNWPGYDPLFNAALLRRPARRFITGFSGKIGVLWADRHEHDPSRNSQVRIFSRDAGRQLTYFEWPNDGGVYGFNDSYARHVAQDGEITGAVGPGVAAWNDLSAVSNTARDTLREAAGITVPRSRFVATLLAAYLITLVPMNWIVFRLVRRVEWAWIAAPAIAVVFGVVVVRMAQLDIGFARSLTEVALVEVQGDYPRAHLTRYGALYTSLTTDYSLALADPAAVALPFRVAESPTGRRGAGTVLLRSEPETSSSDALPVRLSDFEVDSNSTGMLHSEEMFDLGGSFTCTRHGNGQNFRLHNGSRLRLEAARVCTAAHEAQLGTVDAGASVEFTMKPRKNKALPLLRKSEPIRDELHMPRLQARTAGGEPPAPIAGDSGEATNDDTSPDATAPKPRSSSLDLKQLVETAANYIEPGELRLVALVPDDLTPCEIDPTANQSQRGAVLVVHLDYGALPAPEIDFNSRAAVAAENPPAPALDILIEPGENLP